MVARDGDGDMVVAAAGAVPSYVDALHSEIVAMMHAIDMVNQLGIDRLILAPDCLVLKKALTSNEYDLAHLGALFIEARFLLRTSFIEYKIVFVLRVCNKPAHVLAALCMAAWLGCKTTTRSGLSMSC
jgi:hypothetical protein